MNAKRAKQLRKTAKAATVGQPNESYMRSKESGQIILNPTSTKGFYRQLKKLG